MNGYYPKPWSLVFHAPEPQEFTVIVPRTQAKMEQGLQGFAPLGPREGMLFLSRSLPRPEEIPMWMATVAQPLDMVWLGDSMRVDRIERRVPVGDRNTYAAQALAVAELRGGACDACRIRVGTPWSIAPSAL